MQSSFKVFFSASKKIFIGVLLLAIVLLVIFYFYRNSSQVDNVLQPARDDFLTPSNPSTFEKVEVSKFDYLLSHVNKMLAPNSTYWETWEYKSDFVHADIIKVFPESKELSISVSRPSNQSFSNKAMRVGVNCFNDNAALISIKNSRFIRNISNIFLEAKIGDSIYGRCLDVECLNIGKECALVTKNE